MSMRGHAIGKPFSNEMNSIEHELIVKEGPIVTETILRAVSRDFPGMVIEQHTKLGTGTEIELWLELINEGEGNFAGWVKLYFGAFGYNSVVIPLRTGLVRGENRFWMSGTDAMPQDPGDYAEPWLAYEGKRGITGLHTGVFDGIEFNHWSGGLSPIGQARVPEGNHHRKRAEYRLHPPGRIGWGGA